MMRKHLLGHQNSNSTLEPLAPVIADKIPGIEGACLAQTLCDRLIAAMLDMPGADALALPGI
jgi:hypothetical protein